MRQELEVEDENDDWGWAPCPSVMGYFPNLEQPGPRGARAAQAPKKGFPFGEERKGPTSRLSRDGEPDQGLRIVAAKYGVRESTVSRIRNGVRRGSSR